MRIVYAVRVTKHPARADISFHYGWSVLWSYAELSIGIIVACLLSVPKLAQAKGWKLEATISRIRKPFVSVGRLIPSAWRSRREKKESAQRTDGTSTHQMAAETDVVFETGSYHLYPLASDSSRV
jgi:hypothetical protein